MAKKSKSKGTKKSKGGGKSKSWYDSLFYWKIGDIGSGGARAAGITRFFLLVLFLFSIIVTFAFAPQYMGYV